MYALCLHIIVVSSCAQHDFAAVIISTGTIGLSSLQADVNLYLYDDSTSLLDASLNSSTAPEEIIYVPTSAGTLYISVVSINNSSTYSIALAYS